MPQVDELTLLINSNVTGAVAGLTTVETKAASMATKVAGSFTAMGAAATAAGKVMVLGLTVPILAAGVAVLKLGMDAQDAFASLEANAGVPKAVLDDIQDDLIDVASLMGVSIPEAADAFFMVWSGGMRDAETALAAVEAVLMGVNANLGESADIAQLVAVVYANLGVDAVETLDVLTTAAGAAIVGPAEMGKALAKIVGPAGLLRISLQDTATDLVFLTNKFGNADQAAMAMKAALSQILNVKPAAVAALDAIGLSADGLREMVDEDGLAGALKGLKGQFNDIGMSDAEWMAALFPDTNAFIAGSALLEGNMEELAATIANSEGALGTAFAVVEQTASFKLKQALATVKNFGAEIGLELINILTPYLPVMKEKFDEFIGYWRDLSDETHEAIFKVLGIVALIGPALLIFGKFATILGTLLPWIIKIGSAFLGMNPIVLAIVAVIAVLVGLFFRMGGDLETLKEVAVRVWERIQEVVGVAVGVMGTLMDNLVTWWTDNWDTIKGLFDDASAFIMDIFQAIYDFVEPLVADMAVFLEETFGEIVEWFDENWPKIQETVEIVLNAINDVIQRVLPIVKDLFLTTFTFIGEVVKIAMDLIKDIIRSVMHIIMGIIEVIMSLIRGDFSSAWEGMKKIVDGAWDLIFGIVKAALRLIKAAIKQAWSVIKNGIRFLFAIVQALWRTGWNRLKDMVSSIWGAMAEIIKGAFKGALNWVIDKINWAIDKLNGLIGGFNKIPGIPDIPKMPNIPNVAAGGSLLRGGTINVGEAGPERITLPQGAIVEPLTPGTGGVGGGIIINLNAPQNDPRGIGREVGWELAKRGVA